MLCLIQKLKQFLQNIPVSSIEIEKSPVFYILKSGKYVFKIVQKSGK